MLDMTTTITVNGDDGDRFLSSLGRYQRPVPRALRWLATGEHRSIEVDASDAELCARFVEDLLAQGWIDTDGRPPLLFSPRVGDEVILPRDVLAELARAARGTPATWTFLPAGTRGKLIGWRDREGDEPRAVIDVANHERRLVVFVGERRVTRALRTTTGRMRAVR